MWSIFVCKFFVLQKTGQCILIFFFKFFRNWFFLFNNLHILFFLHCWDNYSNDLLLLELFLIHCPWWDQRINYMSVVVPGNYAANRGCAGKETICTAEHCVLIGVYTGQNVAATHCFARLPSACSQLTSDPKTPESWQLDWSHNSRVSPRNSRVLTIRLESQLHECRLRLQSPDN